MGSPKNPNIKKTEQVDEMSLGRKNVWNTSNKNKTLVGRNQLIVPLPENVLGRGTGLGIN